jgi:outer membrane receptor protein involved in Fe transport
MNPSAYQGETIMRLKRILPAGALGLVALLFAASASAQTTTAGAIQGTVSDEATGGPMLLVTVVASSPALQGTQSEFTDASGQYFMSNLPPGSYSLLFIYGDTKVKRDNVDVGVGKVTVANAKINTSATGEVITIVEKAPTIDAGSSKQGVTISQDYMKNIPSRGRTWSAVASSAGGSQEDFGLGTSFSGSGSLENNYVVDGLNTTGVTLGQGFPTQGSQVLNNFIQEIEVITGGYNAEFGRSTGGVVNVVTKTGSNEFHGSVFANINPFNANADSVPRLGSSLRSEANLPTQFDFGFDIGGPIIKDKLWFYVGFAPVLTRQSVARVVSTRVDRGVNGFNYRDANCAAKNFDGTCDGDGDPNTTAAHGCELHATGTQGACEGDGVADLDPATNKTAFEEVSRHSYDQNLNAYQFTAKLNFAVTPEHQGQISFTGQPQNGRTILVLNGTPTAGQEDETEIPTDLSFKWTSKFFDNKTQVDAILGWHRNRLSADPITATLPNDPTMVVKDTPLQRLGSGSGSNPAGGRMTLGIVGRNRDTNEDANVLKFCTDGGADDEFSKIANCPVGARYFVNSPGFLTDTLEQRFAAKLTVTERVKAAGHHQFKVGVDFESNVLDDTRGLYGGERDTYTTLSGHPTWDVLRYVKLDPSGSDVCGFDADNKPVPCDYLQTLPVHGNTWNIGFFGQDSWSILPNLTINAGIRYEQQRLAWAEAARNTIDPATGDSLGTNALELTDLIAPRIGLIFDWTKEGRSKIYANWGRFYESIPMDINNRSFGGEVTLDQFWDASSGGDCGAPTTDPLDPALLSQVRNCPKNIPMDPNKSGFGQSLIGASTATDKDPHSYGLPAFESEMIVPKTHAQYLDELVLGVEYEVLEDLRVGASYQNRQLGRVIEDMSSDGAATYFIGNPGEFDTDGENQLLSQIKSHMNDADQTVRQQLINRLQAFRAAKRFDKPQRVYNAFQLTASKRFSRNFMVQGSYTYSQERGNYPGLFSPDHGQLDPNITAQFDLYDLAPNRIGVLPYDRPHIFKLDGYYTFDLKDAGRLTAGARFRAQSGLAYTPLGFAPNTPYGPLESYIIPRGDGGRTSFQANADLHIAYARRLGNNLDLELYFELYNVFNNQEQASVDQDYTDDPVDPIVGGTAKDLPYLKPAGAATATGGANGLDPNAGIHPATKNLNYGNSSALVSPLSGRFGATLSF